MDVTNYIPEIFPRHFIKKIFPQRQNREQRPTINMVNSVSTVKAGTILSILKPMKTGIVDLSRLPAIKKPLKAKNDGTRNRRGSFHCVAKRGMDQVSTLTEVNECHRTSNTARIIRR
jgi:hypothetical protein